MFAKSVLVRIRLVGISGSPSGLLYKGFYVFSGVKLILRSVYFILTLYLDSQTPRERVRRRARNTMAGMVNSALDRRLNAAMDAMTDAEIRRLDNSASRLGMDGDRIIELP